MLHHIQKDIINTLASTDPARYADLKPEELDGNQFTYHLKQLITEKLVQKNNDGTYSLTKSGQTYLVHRYENLSDAAHSIFLVVIRCGHKILMRERKVQPMLGWVGFVHGEPVAGKHLSDNIRERVRAKTGIELDKITIHGSGLIHLPESFSHAIIVSADVYSDKLPIAEDETGKNYWVNDIESIQRLLPSTYDILSYIDDPTQRWFDWQYRF